MNRLLLVDCQKTLSCVPDNSMYQIAGFGRGSTNHEDLERLPADWERGCNFRCKPIPYLDILWNNSKNALFLATPVSVK